MVCVCVCNRRYIVAAYCYWMATCNVEIVENAPTPRTFHRIRCTAWQRVRSKMGTKFCFCLSIEWIKVFFKSDDMKWREREKKVSHILARSLVWICKRNKKKMMRLVRREPDAIGWSKWFTEDDGEKCNETFNMFINIYLLLVSCKCT